MKLYRYLIGFTLLAMIYSCSGNKQQKQTVDDETQTSSSTYIETYKTSSSTSTSTTNNTDYMPTTSYDDDVDLDEYGRGFLAGGEDGADDALEGRSRRYKYGSGHSSEYIRGYKEAYDETYSEGVKVTEEAEREMQRLESEYGLDDIDVDYNDYDF